MTGRLKQPLLTLVNDLRSGALSFDTYLGRLEELFQVKEPIVQSFLAEEGRFDRLRREARDLEEKYPQPMRRPPLFGLPLGVKDIFRVNGFLTRAGSTVPEDELAGREAASIRILKEAGVLVMGKTVTTEFAYFAPGPTRNPTHPDHTPGGSSSGSAAAIAAGLCPIATGTQTIGSITRPASYCGIVGFKPSYDRISREGVIPLSPSLDHVGVFADDIAGVELLASILCPDWQLAIVDETPVLGIPEGPFLANATDEALDHFHNTCRRLVDNGCEVKSVDAMSDFKAIVSRHKLILAAEAAQVHSRWYSEYSERYHPKTTELIKKGRDVSVGDLAEALTGRRQLRHDLTLLMDEHGIDLWISPAAPGPAPEGLESTGNPIMNLPWTHSGLPTINIPSGANERGLPMGLQVAGRWYEDEALLEWSANLEPSVCPD